MIKAKANEAKQAKQIEDEKVGLIEKKEDKVKPNKKSVEHEVDNSIFDLAFVSLLDPAAMEDWNKEFPGEYLKPVHLDKVEATAVF